MDVRCRAEVLRVSPLREGTRELCVKGGFICNMITSSEEFVRVWMSKVRISRVSGQGLWVKENCTLDRTIRTKKKEKTVEMKTIWR